MDPLAIIPLKAMNIGIALGDVAGIGPEIVAKALQHRRHESGLRYTLIGSARWLPAKQARRGGVWGDVDIVDLGEGLAEREAAGSPRAAQAALSWLREGARRCLAGELSALVTAPVNKASIVRSGEAFVGQTEYLARIAGTEDVAMMLLGADDRDRWLRVVLATTHLPLRQVAAKLTTEAVQRAIGWADRAGRDLGLPRVRIGVCGLNPHAGEDGEMGDEEARVIAPAIAHRRREGIEVVGPFPADTLFYQAFRGDFDLVVAMYHDQGLGPLKMIGFERGVNWTLGLPFIRTSPDHGTAYDIAGRGVAKSSSFSAALDLAVALARRPRR